MFYRFDWSGDGALDLDEAKKLIKFLLKDSLVALQGINSCGIAHIALRASDYMTHDSLRQCARFVDPNTELCYAQHVPFLNLAGLG